MKEKCVSVILPIYNVEKYLAECIESVIHQTYTNLEIILVDDGSTDNCFQICEKYAKKDDRIQVIHKTNGGLSDARNYGIDKASGDYIVFIDSDDYVTPYFVENLYKAIIMNQVQVSQCNITKVDDKKKILEKIGYDKQYNLSGEMMLQDTYSQKHNLENTVVWNKMYAIELFQNLRFPVGKIHEDEFTTYKILYPLDKVAIVNTYDYYYRQVSQSITGKKYNEKRLVYLEALEERLDFFKEKNHDILYQYTLKIFSSELIESYIKVNLYIENSKKIQKNIIKIYRKYFPCFLKLKKQRFQYYIKLYIFYIMPKCIFYLRKITN